MQLSNNIDKNLLDRDIVKKTERVEQQENSICDITFQVIVDNIWMVIVKHRSNDGDSVFFTSLNLYQQGCKDYIFNMQDGKMYGFDTGDFTNRDEGFKPETPEAFISEILQDLFGYGWD